MTLSSESPAPVRLTREQEVAQMLLARAVRRLSFHEITELQRILAGDPDFYEVLPRLETEFAAYLK